MAQRIIKFRGRHITSGEWLYGSHYDDGGEEYILPNNVLDIDNYEMFQVDGNTVCQFTGIKDAHNRDIYEGDIVKVDGCPDLGNLIVVFYEGAFALATPKEYDCLQRGEHPYMNDYAHLTPLGDFDYQGLYIILGNMIYNPKPNLGE